MASAGFLTPRKSPEEAQAALEMVPPGAPDGRRIREDRANWEAAAAAAAAPVEAPVEAPAAEAAPEAEAAPALPLFPSRRILFPTARE